MGCCPVATALPNDDNLNDKSQPLESPGDRHQANRLHADRLKEQGNVMFKRGKYQEAFVLYGRAIGKYPLQPTYFTNRAMCMRRLGRWSEALQNIDSALQLNPSHFKAKVNKAICLAELAKEATNLETKREYLSEAQQLLESVRHIRQLAAQIEPIQQKITTMTEYYQQEGHQNEQEKFRQYLLKASNQKGMPDSLKIHFRDKEHLKEQLKAIFRRDQQLGQCPEYFQDPVTYELFKKPYLSPSGITYEKQLLLDHIRVNGATDPTTKEDLSRSEPVPNKELMSLVESHVNITRWRKTERTRVSPQFINF